jgi:hypothetical protein
VRGGVGELQRGTVIEVGYKGRERKKGDAWGVDTLPWEHERREEVDAQSSVKGTSRDLEGLVRGMWVGRGEELEGRRERDLKGAVEGPEGGRVNRSKSCKYPQVFCTKSMGAKREWPMGWVWVLVFECLALNKWRLRRRPRRKR